MPVTAFQVKSNRIHDIDLPEGATVSRLRSILQDAGYDVAEALVTVNRYAESDVLIGDIETYVIKDGDTLEFKTVKMDLPITRSRIGNAVKEAAEAASRDSGSCQCKCSSACGKADTVLVGDLEIGVVDDGILIKIHR